MDMAISFWFQVLKNVSDSLKAELRATRLEVLVFNYSVGVSEISYNNGSFDGEFVIGLFSFLLVFFLIN